MKKVLLILSAIYLALPVVAQDFEYTYEGQTITYTIISESEKTARTKMGSFYEGYFQNHDPGQTVAGVLILPAHPKYGDTEYTLTQIPDNAFYGSEKLTSVTIPNTVEKIESYAFSGCGLTSVSIPKSVLNIDKSVFYNCKNLTEINVDSDNKNYTSNDGVLYDKNATLLIKCPEAKSYVKIPDTVKEIGIGAFSDCQNLTSIEIPNSVKIIAAGAFENCYNLSTVKFGNRVNTIKDSAFASCRSLSSIELPNSLTTIEGYAFYCCSGMTSAKIGDNVNSIYERAFSGCVELTSIEIPRNVISIGTGAFWGCLKLNTVYYNTNTPQLVSRDNVFSSHATTLYVQSSAIEKCEEISPWKYFTNILPYDFSGIDEIENDETESIDRNEPHEVYNLNGVRVADTINGLSKGLYILKQGTRVQKIAVK